VPACLPGAGQVTCDGDGIVGARQAKAQEGTPVHVLIVGYRAGLDGRQGDEAALGLEGVIEACGHLP
jgi:hypothetical protein